MFMKQFGFMTVNVQRLSRLTGIKRVCRSRRILRRPRLTNLHPQALLIWSCLHFGAQGAKDNYRNQIGTIVAKARERLGEVPVVMGETGLPIDMKWVLVQWIATMYD